jgi:hypothetical protein
VNGSYSKATAAMEIEKIDVDANMNKTYVHPSSDEKN